LSVGLVVGTRPEAIKLAPVYHALEAAGDEPTIVLTGQQGAILDPLLRHFRLDRRVGLPDHSAWQLDRFHAHCLTHCTDLLRAPRFDTLVVQGDTTSAAAAALAATYAGVPLAHVEAGLRTGDRSRPFPEEAHRQLIARLADWHFAPTASAAANLARENVSGQIEVVGNTVVDAARWTAGQPGFGDKLRRSFPDVIDRPHVLVTAHRRESFGAPMAAIGDGVARLARLHPDIAFVVPLHPNPAAHGPLSEALEGLGNAFLTGPLPYDVTIALVAGALAIVTDSGGLQEEAPTFGVPVLVLREVTERPEGIAAGFSRLVGTDPARIVAEFERVRTSPPAHVANPYGDGRSGERIAASLRPLVERALAC
jgi:UDP-N-acetylglucosamine 2-epimerase (non-hydrolysing)